MQRLEVSCAVREIYIYIYNVSRLRVNVSILINLTQLRSILLIFLHLHQVFFPLVFSLDISNAVEIGNEGKRPLGRLRRRWEDNIKMDLREVGGGCEDWMELAQDRDRWRALVSTVMNLRVPKMRGIS